MTQELERKEIFGDSEYLSLRRPETPILVIKYEYGKRFSQYFTQIEFPAQYEENGLSVPHALIVIDGKLSVILEGEYLEITSSGSAPVRVWNEYDLFNKYRKQTYHNE